MVTLRAKEIGDDRSGFLWSSDFKADWLITGLNNNSEREKRTALTLQINKATEMGRHFRGGLKAIRIAQRQGRHIASGITNGIQDRSASLPHFSFSETAGYR